MKCVFVLVITQSLFVSQCTYGQFQCLYSYSNKLNKYSFTICDIIYPAAAHQREINLSLNVITSPLYMNKFNKSTIMF